MAKYRLKECELEFINYDTIHLKAQKKAKELVRLMSKDVELLKILIESTYHFRFDISNPCNKRFLNEIDTKIKFFGKFKVELECFKIEYEKILIADSSNFYAVRDFIYYSNKVRGNIIEYITNLKAEKENVVHGYGCIVMIDNIEMNYNKKRTVDYAGHNHKRCHFYECKVSPNNFSEEEGINQVNLLLNIKNTLNSKSVVGDIFCVTAGNKFNLIKQLKGNFSKEQIENVNVIGIDELVS